MLTIDRIVKFYFYLAVLTAVLSIVVYYKMECLLSSGLKLYTQDAMIESSRFRFKIIMNNIY